jgi:hypothetical protein
VSKSVGSQTMVLEKEMWEEKKRLGEGCGLKTAGGFGLGSVSRYRCPVLRESSAVVHFH